MVKKYSNQINVMIVDDDAAIRTLYQNMINDEPSLICQHAFRTPKEALTAVEEVSPDVILLDIKLPGISGVACLKILRERGIQIPVLMLSAEEDDELLYYCLCEGATGYLLKGLPPDELISAIKEAYSGSAHMNAEMAKRVYAAFLPDSIELLEDLELVVLNALCQGDTYREIAAKLNAEQPYIRKLIYSIYGKLEKVHGSKKHLNNEDDNPLYNGARYLEEDPMMKNLRTHYL